MKRIISVLTLMVICFSLSAQTVEPENAIPVFKRSYGSLRQNGVKLSSQQTALLLSYVNGEDLSQSWQKAATWRKVGNIMWVGGTVVMACSAAYDVALIVALAFSAGFSFGQADLTPIQRQLSITTGVFIGSGVVTATGITLHAVNNHKLNGIVKKCNIAASSTPSGLGITFNF